MTDSSPLASDANTLHSPHRLGVILVGAGRGERLGAGIPKAFVQLGGKSLLERAIETVLSIHADGHLVAVVPESHAAGALNVLEEVSARAHTSWGTNVAFGGVERHFSVMNGLELMPEWVEIVLVHDVARPLTPAAVFVRVAHAVAAQKRGVVPVMPVIDTVKRVNADGDVLETVNRNELVLAQTPQGFPREQLVAAYARVDGVPTDDAEVFQGAGFAVTTVEGDQLAHKVTSAADIRTLESLLVRDPQSVPQDQR